MRNFYQNSGSTFFSGINTSYFLNTCSLPPQDICAPSNAALIFPVCFPLQNYPLAKNNDCPSSSLPQ